MWKEIKSEKDLPREGKYVLAKHNRGTWHDSDDQENVNCVVVKLVKGLTEEDRELMRQGKKENLSNSYWCLSEGNHFANRSEIYSGCDVGGNNLVPYNWESFGADSFFGQSITHWMEIPSIK